MDPSAAITMKKALITAAIALLAGSFLLALPSREISTEGGHIFKVEVALTPQQREQGLMNRKTLERDHGMIFVFPTSSRQSFWMKNTYTALDLAYLDASGKILEIYPLYPLDETPITSRTASVAYALELPAGTLSKEKIKVGAQIMSLPSQSEAS